MEFLDKIIGYHTFLNNFRSKSIEFGNVLNFKVESYKKDIEKDENKYNEQKLKLIKCEVDKVSKSLNPKMETLIDSNNKVLQVFNSVLDEQQAYVNRTALLASLEHELKEIKHAALVAQPVDLPSYVYSVASNSVRPVSSMSAISHVHDPEQTLLSFNQKSN